MLRLATRHLQATYSNIRLNVQADRRAAFLTLANSRKRNPLSLATIREINGALGEVQQAIQTQKLKVPTSTDSGFGDGRVGTCFFGGARPQGTGCIRQPRGHLRGVH